MTIKESFDLLLIHTSQRVHSYYLNIIKELSASLSIGVIEDPVCKISNSKLQNTEKLFLGLCEDFGASVLPGDSRYRCGLLLVPQDTHGSIKFGLLDYGKIIVLHRFGSGSAYIRPGTLELDEFINDLNAKKIWVYEKNIFTERVYEQGGGHLLEQIEVVEMGTPYKKYPAFDFSGLNMDYLLAYPTPMFLGDPMAQIGLLENINAILKGIPWNEKVFLKYHNVRDGGFQFGNGKLYRIMGRILKELACRFNRNAIRFVAATNLPALMELFHKNQVESLGSIIKDRSLCLPDVTDMYNLAFEHFLPFVKKGIITGISSCIWHALHHGIPVYNCDNRLLTKDMPNYSVYKNFYIPPCHAKMEFDPIYFEKVSSSAKKADVIELIKNEL